MVPSCVLSRNALLSHVHDGWSDILHSVTFWRVWHHALGNTAVRAMRSEMSSRALLMLVLTPLTSSLEGLHELISL